MEFELSFLDRDQMDQDWDQILRVYREAFGTPPYERTEIHVLDFSGVLTSHRQREGFRFAAARKFKARDVVGIAYGYTSGPGHWWYDIVSNVMSAEMTEKYLLRAFELVEFAVLPAYQGRGIGGQLHDYLLRDLPHTRAVLSTMNTETNALHLYRKRGWQTLLENFNFPGVGKPYLIMGLDLVEFRAQQEEKKSSGGL